MALWRNRPHVRRWWDHDFPEATVDSMREEYQADMAKDASKTLCFIEYRDAPIGFIQFYLWRDYAKDAQEVGIPFDGNTWGVDIFIGDEGSIRRGLGTRAIRALSDLLINERGASSIALTTALDNHAAQRCYEKAGFVKIREVLDLDTHNGVRIPSWLMVKRPSAALTEQHP